MSVHADSWFRDRRAYWAKRLARRFRRSEDGAVAIEFGLVIVPFLALLFAILETALVFFAGQVLETAVSDASRLILTGQAKTQNLTAEQFKDRVCARIPALFNCQALVQIDVRAFGDSFASATVGTPIKDGRLNWGTGNGAPLYSNPGDRQIVVVRAAMEYPIYVSFFGQTMANLSNGTRLIMASATFRNEPFGG